MPLRGKDKLIAKLKSLDKEVQIAVKDVVGHTVFAIEADAVRNINGGSFRHGGDTYKASIAISQSIQSDFEAEGFIGRVEVNAGPMAAYIEFGCGIHAAALVPTLPKEWQEIAKSFYVNGEGTIPATPYLYPAYLKNTKEFTEKMKQALIKATDK